MKKSLWSIVMLGMFLTIGAQAHAQIPVGAWSFNGNGFQGELIIETAGDGKVEGKLLGDRIVGFFDEKTRCLTLLRFRDGSAFQSYKGYLFHNPEQGQTQPTLAGLFQVYSKEGGTGSGMEYGWYAKFAQPVLAEPQGPGDRVAPGGARDLRDETGPSGGETSEAPATSDGLTGRWSGITVRPDGDKSEVFTDVTEHEDGTLSGTWGGVPRDVLTIQNGTRVSNDLLQWESTQSYLDSHWSVRCRVMGENKAMVLDYTYTGKQDGKVVGNISVGVLTKAEEKTAFRAANSAVGQ